jgi:hypothetical protein
MKGTARLKAKKAVACLLDTSIPPILRVQGLYGLESEGHYSCAVEAGLHQALLAVLREDLQTLEDDAGCIQKNSFCICMITTLFRGERIGRAISDRFRKVDGGRIKAFAESNPEAFQVWWKVAIKIAALPLRDEVYESPLYAAIYEQARAIWAGFSILFANDRASRAVLLTADKERCKKRAEWMLTQQKATLKALWGAPEGRNRDDRMEAHMNACAAMIICRCREVGLNVKVEKILGLKGNRKIMYQNIAMPLGEATIKKGTALTIAESGAILDSAGYFE